MAYLCSYMSYAGKGRKKKHNLLELGSGKKETPEKTSEICDNLQHFLFNGEDGEIYNLKFQKTAA